MTATAAALHVSNVSKTFQGVRVLDRVDLELRTGEVHALLGQNGSGKSTLIKISAGYHQPDEGAAATCNGRRLELGSAASANRNGLRFIHQDLALIDGLTVAEISRSATKRSIAFGLVTGASKRVPGG